MIRSQRSAMNLKKKKILSKAKNIYNFDIDERLLGNCHANLANDELDTAQPQLVNIIIIGLL